MSQSINRRTFLKGGVAAACSLAAAPVAGAIASPDEGQQLATLLDLRKCVGCEACVEACYDANLDKYPEPAKPFPKMYPSRVKVSDWSDRRDVTDRLTPYNWLYIQRATVETPDGPLELNIPRRCMHCVNPPCVKLCPWGAAKQLENGISRIDADICLGGSKCNAVCPWDIPQRQTGVGLYLDILPQYAGNGVMYKCDRCYDRVAEGQLPACIEACPEGVQSIGPRDEMVRRARALAEENGGYVYGVQENGGTNTFYVSPVPFEAINRSLSPAKGRPHFAPVADTMAQANNLAAAMLIAPLAGIAAAVGRFFKQNKIRTRGDR